MSHLGVKFHDNLAPDDSSSSSKYASIVVFSYQTPEMMILYFGQRHINILP